MADTEPYCVRVLLSEPKSVDPGEVLETLLKILPDQAPMQVSFVPQALDAESEATADALSQTWDWPGAAHALEHVQAAIRVVSYDTGERLDRLHRINALMRALLEHVPAVALHWEASQRLIDPHAYVNSLAHGSTVIDHAVNVRLFRIGDGRPDEMIMDTIGLAPFGLPDLQCHFAGADPSRMGPVLAGYAEYLFDKGDVLTEDSLIRGIQSHDEWSCERGLSLVPPARDAIDIRPDDFWVPS